MKAKILTISFLCLAAGFASAYFIFAENSAAKRTNTVGQSGNNSETPLPKVLGNPFEVRELNRLDQIDNEIADIKEQLQQLEFAIQTLASTEDNRFAAPVSSDLASRRPASFNQRIYNIEHLVKGGLDPAYAEDIVRRKNSVELKRLELQDRATRENYINTQRYYDELDQLNAQDINLRDELGDQQYDEYLYNSKQNNRIRINSVMLESVAEQAGILNGDIVLSYDNKRMFNWQELKDATAEGQLGEYVSISIYRNGEIYSFSVPRGPLGVQLGATRLAP
jgi:hypothetical protein